MKHPCVNKCNSHLTTDGICTGCYRSVDEIREYNGLSETEQMQVLKLCDERRKEYGIKDLRYVDDTDVVEIPRQVDMFDKEGKDNG